MGKRFWVGVLGLALSSMAMASDWKKLPNGDIGYYSENNNIGSQVILSDAITGPGIMEVVMLTLNPECESGRGSSGRTNMYVNNSLVRMGFVCTGAGMSIYFGVTDKDKDYIFNEFLKKDSVCYKFRRAAKGACFSAMGFSAAAENLSKAIVKRDNAP